MMGMAPCGLGSSLLPPNVTNILSGKADLPPALCPLWGRVKLTARK